MSISDDVRPESVRLDNLRDDILYYLLNKVKHSEQGQDVSYSTGDFGEKMVDKAEAIEHLDHLVKEGSLEGNIERGADSEQSSDASSPLVTLKNAKITSKGENLTKTKFFKV